MLVRDEFSKIETNFGGFFFVLHVVVNLDSDGLQLICQSLEGLSADLFTSDEAEQCGRFELGPGASSIAGVELADADFSGGLEELSLVLLGDTLKVVLLHFTLGEGEVEVDVERPDENPVGEVGFVVEVECLFVVSELDFDDAVLAID